MFNEWEKNETQRRGAARTVNSMARTFLHLKTCQMKLKLLYVNNVRLKVEAEGQPNLTWMETLLQRLEAMIPCQVLSYTMLSWIVR